MPGRIHVIGAGLAGLAAAVALAGSGVAVTLYEASGHGGGRCRSYVDARLGRRIDNGNHLLLSGNRAALAFLARIGASDRVVEPSGASIAFVDVGTGERWVVRPGAGVIPFWLFSPGRRAPGTRARDYLKGLRLAWAGGSATVADCLGDTGAAFERFWRPLALAVLNTAPEDAAARLLWPVLSETFGRGARACRPLIAAEGLSKTFVEPALGFLAWHGVETRWHARANAFSIASGASGRVAAITFAGGEAVALGASDAVVLAVPPQPAAALVPGLETPQECRAIVNAHFRLDQRRDQPSIVGLIGGVGHWLFVRDDVASVTVSAADQLAAEDGEAIATRLWRDVSAALGIERWTMPVWRVVKERRATFAQTPDGVRRRPRSPTTLANLFLAGDWTDTGLPATIEGSVRSGNTAAALALRHLSGA